MNFQTGQDVYTASGDKVGTVKQLVIRAHNQEITHLVISRGFLFTEERVMPVSWVAREEDDRHILRDGIGDFATLPNFEEKHYVAVNQLPQTNEPRGEVDVQYAPPQQLYYYGPLGTWDSYHGGSFYVDVPHQQMAEVTEQNIPAGTVALKSGTDVYTVDDELVGQLDEVITAPDDRRAVYFIISRGLVFKERRLVPTAWITQVESERIQLGVPTHLLNRLPEVEQDELV